MGRASGALMVWWDSPLMAILLEHSAAWRAFDAYVNSPAFLRGVIDTFGPQLLQNNPELRHASTLEQRFEGQLVAQGRHGRLRGALRI